MNVLKTYKVRLIILLALITLVVLTSLLPRYNEIYFVIRHGSVFGLYAYVIYVFIMYLYHRFKERFVKHIYLNIYTVFVFGLLLFGFSALQLQIIEQNETMHFQNCTIYDSFNNLIYYSYGEGNCPEVHVEEVGDTTIFSGEELIEGKMVSITIDRETYTDIDITVKILFDVAVTYHEGFIASQHIQVTALYDIKDEDETDVWYSSFMKNLEYTYSDQGMVSFTSVVDDISIKGTVDNPVTLSHYSFANPSEHFRRYTDVLSSVLDVESGYDGTYSIERVSERFDEEPTTHILGQLSYGYTTDSVKFFSKFKFIREDRYEYMSLRIQDCFSSYYCEDYIGYYYNQSWNMDNATKSMFSYVQQQTILDYTNSYVQSDLINTKDYSAYGSVKRSQTYVEEDYMLYKIVSYEGYTAVELHSLFDQDTAQWTKVRVDNLLYPYLYKYDYTSMLYGDVTYDVLLPTNPIISIH